MTDQRSRPASEASTGADLVKRTAALARLDVSDAEAARLGPQFDRIIEAFEVLARLDVADAPAMTRGSGPGGEEAVLREDEPRASLPVDAALANAPQRIESFYSVPKTLGGDA